MGELARIEKQSMSVPEVMDVAKAFAASGYFKDARDAAQVAVKIMAGQELGIPPVAAMTGIAIVKEKVTLGANLIAALVKASGRYDYRVTTHTETECVIQFYEHGKPTNASTFTMADAKKAGLSGTNWTSYPKAMLFARAMTQGVRWNCPDVMSGIAAYTPDELGEDTPPAVVDTQTGEIIEAEVVQQAEPATPDDPEAGKRTKMVDAIYTTWNMRDGFNMWLRRRNSIKGQAGNTWTEELDALDAEPSVRLWLDNVPLATLRAYGKHNADRAKAERDAQIEQEREVDYA